MLDQISSLIRRLKSLSGIANVEINLTAPMSPRVTVYVNGRRRVELMELADAGRAIERAYEIANEMGSRP